jgi:2-polyprenyl-6-methoxyphenol hydroxylase-like FAD-dependent oxidoreductase
VSAPRGVVVGAGIAGLASAVALRGAGVDVIVIERGRVSPDGGLPIGRCWNAVLALQHLGLADAVVADARLTRVAEIRDHGDRLIAATREEDLSAAVPALAAVVLRGSLLSALASRLDDGCIRFGASFTGFDENVDGVVVRLDGGADVRADLLVGADGLHSAVRSQVRSEAHIRYTGATAWRGIGRGVADLLPPGRGIEWWHGGGIAGAHHLGQSDVYWYGSMPAPPGPRAARPASVPEVAAQYAGWPEPFLSAVAATVPDGLLRTDLHDLAPILRWGAGHATLAGDAAHAMSPALGQGGGTALEDAVILGRFVARHGCTPQALRRYEVARRRRALALAEASHLWSRIIHTRSRGLGAARNQVVKVVVRLPARRALVRSMTGWDRPAG